MCCLYWVFGQIALKRRFIWWVCPSSSGETKSCSVQMCVWGFSDRFRQYNTAGPRTSPQHLWFTSNKRGKEKKHNKLDTSAKTPSSVNRALTRSGPDPTVWIWALASWVFFVCFTETRRKSVLIRQCFGKHVLPVKERTGKSHLLCESRKWRTHVAV